METKNGKLITIEKILINQSYTPTYDDIFPRVKPILLNISQTFEEAIPKTKEFFETQNKKIDRYLFPHLVRFFVKDRLETAGFSVKLDEEEEPTTEFQFERLTNNGLLVTYAGFRLRILKADNGELPVPFSETKSKYYNQQLYLMTDLPVNSHDICPNLIVLWETDMNYDFYQLKLACPKSGYKTRESVRAYFNEPVPHGVELIKAKVPLIVEEDIEVTKKEKESAVINNDDIRSEDKTSS